MARRVQVTERRAAYDPAAKCGYCGAPREDHDRQAREWEACAVKAAWFAALEAKK